MTTAKLVTVRNPNPNTHSAAKLKTKLHEEHNGCPIVSYIVRHSIWWTSHWKNMASSQNHKSKVASQSSRSTAHISLLNNIIHDINHKNHSLNNGLYTLDRQQQEEHDTWIVQTAECNRYHTTPDAGKCSSRASTLSMNLSCIADPRIPRIYDK